MANRDIIRETGNIYHNSRKCEYMVSCTNNNHLISFFGYSQCHPKDKFDQSIGLKIAELRAKKKYFQWLIQKTKEDKKPIENVYKAMECFKNFNPKSTEAYAVRKQIKAFNDEIEAYKVTISIINQQINSIIS